MSNKSSIDINQLRKELTGNKSIISTARGGKDVILAAGVGLIMTGILLYILNE